MLLSCGAINAGNEKLDVAIGGVWPARRHMLEMYRAASGSIFAL